MKIKLVVFDVDGTLYSKPLLTLLMSLEIFFYLLFFPYKYKEIYFLWSFRKNREFLSNLRNYSLSDREYDDNGFKFNLSLKDKKNIIFKWLINKPLKYLYYLKYSEIVSLINYLQENPQENLAAL